MCGVMHFFAKYKLPWPKESCQLFTLHTNPTVQDTLLQTWESLVNADNCSQFISMLIDVSNKKLMPMLKGILERYGKSLDNGKLLYLLITVPPTAKEVRTVLRAHLMKLPRDQFLAATTKLSVIVRDNADMEALLTHFKLKELPPPAIPVRLPTVEKYELTPERAKLVAELCGRGECKTLDEAPDFSVSNT